MSKGAETKSAILHHGVETAYRVGLGRLTIGELARSTGLSKSGLYAHFGSIQSLQLEVLGRAREEFTDSVIRPAVAAPRGEPRVRELFARWADRGLRRAPGCCLFVKAITEFEEQSGPVHDQLIQDHRDLYDSIAQIFRTGITEGHFRDDADPMQFAFALDGVMFAGYHWLPVYGATETEARSRRAFEALLDAVRS
ncbi:TetR/AcrR family transcriptional regulator [Microlunatus elymi]|uniref:TetR/AcrR family transcriptional regulator n=1 Tax=Microlunatus elymi TaxID=2596828 RepID=A0A516Q182_9ACTN|nr:TetR/AcrR family transcriptional regulator [Microlunatus elymi]QDP97190.1 TetR/AcrR family transcriptional regulator [Microlunatus elymi]